MAGNLTSSNKLTILNSKGWKIAIVGLYGLVFLVGIIGNLLVIYVFGWLKRGKRKTSELLLLSLGICDLTTSVLIPPMMIVMALSAGTYLWFVMGCQLIPFFLSTCITVAQMLLIIICFDRYRIIVTPLKAKFCRGLITAGVVVGCIIGLAIDIPMLLQASKGRLDSGVCFDYTNRSLLIIGQAMALLARDMICFGMMAFFIWKMLIALQRSASFRKNLSTSNSVKDVTEFRRTRKLLYAVLIVFAICILPSDVAFLTLFAYYRGAEYGSKVTESIILIMSAIMMLQTINSSMNVFIYSAIHPDFKKLLKRMKDAASCHDSNPRSQNECSSNITMDSSASQGRL